MRAFIEEGDTITRVDDLKVVTRGARKAKIEALVDTLQETADNFNGETDFALGVQAGLVAAAIGLRGAIDD